MSVTIDTQAVRARVRSRLLGRAGVDLERLSAPERRLRVRHEVLAVLREERAILPASTITDVVNQVSDEVVGLGPLERLLRDPEVSENTSLKGTSCASILVWTPLSTAALVTTRQVWLLGSRGRRRIAESWRSNVGGA